MEGGQIKLLNREYLTKKFCKKNHQKLNSLFALALSGKDFRIIEVSTFYDLINLTELDLSENQFTKFNRHAFDGLDNLVKLRLDRNLLKSIDDCTFKKLTKLVELNLSANLINCLAERAFNKLTNLTKLILSYNQIETISNEVFGELASLKELHLDNNRLSALDSRLFRPLNELAILKLNNNRLNLSKLERAVFSRLKNIQLINIHQNDADANRDRIKSFVKDRNHSEYNIPDLLYLHDFDQFLHQFAKSAQNREDENEISTGMIINNYKIKHSIGKGRYGAVYLAKDLNDSNKQSKLKALKLIRLIDFEDKDIEEIEILKILESKFVIRYFENFQHLFYRVIVTEYCENGDFKSLILEHQQTNRRIDEDRITDWLWQTSKALEYLHFDKKIKHRDIKPSNIFLTSHDKAKLGDFGLSNLIKNTVRASKTEMTLAGTIEYISPEMINDKGYSFNTDVWSLGCVFYELLFLKQAFPNVIDIRDVQKLNFFDSKSNLVPILQKMLTYERKQRPSSKTLCYNLLNINSNSFKFESGSDEIEYLEELSFIERPNLLATNGLNRKSKTPESRLDQFVSKKYNYNRYEILSRIGSGAFGVVYLCLDRLYSLEKAIKIIPLWDTNEAEILSKIRHQHILEYDNHFVEETIHFLVTEYCANGDLNNFIRVCVANKETLDDKLIDKFIFGIIEGLHYLNNRGIIHRDIDPKNLYLTAKNQIKIGDFGLAKIIETKYTERSEQINQKTVLQKKAGKFSYMSPEMLNGESYSFNTDIWSVGCVLYELVFLERAFKNLTEERNVDRLSLNNSNSRFISTIKIMLESDRSRRPTSTQMLNTRKKDIFLLDDFESKKNCNKPVKEKKEESDESDESESSNQVSMTDWSPVLSATSSISAPIEKAVKEKDILIGKKIKSGRYEIRSEIGSGAFGRIYLAFDNVDRIKKAIKIIPEINLSNNILNEANIMKSLNNEYIIRFFDSFKELHFSALVTEYCEMGDLESYIKSREKNKNPISESKIIKWTTQITTALKYLHSLNIIHRDVKPSNVFLMSEELIKLGDLGTASSTSISVSISSDNVAGTYPYMSPEMLSSEVYSYKTDIWSLGCIVYELVFFKLAFPNLLDKRSVSYLNLEGISETMSNLITKILQTDKNERPSADELLKYLSDLTKKPNRKK